MPRSLIHLVTTPPLLHQPDPIENRFERESNQAILYLYRKPPRFISGQVNPRRRFLSFDDSVAPSRNETFILDVVKPLYVHGRPRVKARKISLLIFFSPPPPPPSSVFARVSPTVAKLFLHCRRLLRLVRLWK